MIEPKLNSFWDSIPQDGKVIKISHEPDFKGKSFYYACECGQTHWHYNLGKIKCISCGNTVTLVSFNIKKDSFYWDYVSFKEENIMGGIICFRKSHPPKEILVSLHKPDGEGGFSPLICEKHNYVVNLWGVKEDKAICTFCHVEIKLSEIGATHYKIENIKK